MLGKIFMIIQLEPLENELTDGYNIRKCKIKYLDNNNTITDEKELWFRLDKSIPLPDETDCDAYVMAMMLDAMKAGRKLVVKGCVSGQLLSNLIEFQASWHKCLPNDYKFVDISVDNVRSPRANVPGAICAFSGGLDACFSVWRHSQAKWSYRSQNINLCSIVHGFDIPLEDDAAFANAHKRSASMLDDLNIKLIPIKTNFREISSVMWGHAFAGALAATLSNFKRLAGTCIIGSSEPYDALFIPCGSSPITDHLLSSDEFQIIHDGASHNRTEKAKEVTEWKVGTENLRVCWEGDLKDRNCGYCEKCVRTKINFLAVGANIPKCFPASDIMVDLEQIRLKSPIIRAEWQQMLDVARSHNINAPWVKKLPKIIRKKSMAEILFTFGDKQQALIEVFLPIGSKRRSFLKNTIKRLSKN